VCGQARVHTLKELKIPYMYEKELYVKDNFAVGEWNHGIALLLLKHAMKGTRTTTLTPFKLLNFRFQLAYLQQEKLPLEQNLHAGQIG
jgi:nitrous oxidase accessory protein NosD